MLCKTNSLKGHININCIKSMLLCYETISLQVDLCLHCFAFVKPKLKISTYIYFVSVILIDTGMFGNLQGETHNEEYYRLYSNTNAKYQYTWKSSFSYKPTRGYKSSCMIQNHSILFLGFFSWESCIRLRACLFI